MSGHIWKILLGAAAAAAAAYAKSKGSAGGGWSDVLGHWQANVAGSLTSSFDVHLVLNPNGTFESRLTKLNGREPVWTSGAIGRYRVDGSTRANYEYAKAWMLTLEPLEFSGDSNAAQVTNLYGLPVDKAVSARVQYSPANIGGSFWPTLNYDGPAGTAGFSLARGAGQ